MKNMNRASLRSGTTSDSPIYMQLDSKGKGRKVEREGNIWRNHGQNFSRFDKNYKPTDKKLSNPKHKKHEES